MSVEYVSWGGMTECNDFAVCSLSLSVKAVGSIRSWALYFDLLFLRVLFGILARLV